VKLPILLVLIAPLAAAVLAPALADAPLQRRVLVGAAAAAALGGAAYGLVRTVDSSPVAWRSFSLDPWRGLLVCGAVLSMVAAAAHADARPRGSIAQAAVFTAGTAMIAPLLVGTTHLLVFGLLAGTAGYAAVAFVTSVPGSGSLRAARSSVALILSDVLACGAIGTSLGGGTGLPPHLSTIAGGLLLAAALIRLGLSPFAGPAADADSAGATLGLLWHGPVRAQGFLLVIMALGAGRGVAYTAAAAAVLSILVVSPAALLRGGTSSLPLVATGVGLLGFAIGGAPATWGATLATAAAFASWVAWRAGEGWSGGARATLAAASGGGLIAGSALVAAAVLAAGTVDLWFLALALPAIAGLLAGLCIVWRSVEPRLAHATGPGGGIAAAIAAAIGIAVGLTMAALPGRAASGLGVPVAGALGVGRLLSVGGEPGITDTLGVLALAAGLAAFAAGPGRFGSGGAPRGRSARRIPGEVFAWWAAAPAAPNDGSSTLAMHAAGVEVRRWAMAAAFLFAVSLGLALRIFIVAAGRGFL